MADIDVVKKSSNAWIWVIAAIAVVLVLFFLFGRGRTSGQTGSLQLPLDRQSPVTVQGSREPVASAFTQNVRANS